MPASGSDELDKAYREGDQELDPAKAIQKANEVDKMIWAEVHSADVLSEAGYLGREVRSGQHRCVWVRQYLRMKTSAG